MRSAVVFALVTVFTAVQGAAVKGRDNDAVSVEKRQAVQMFTYRLGQWSPCTRTCGGGLRTRSVLCTDQDGILGSATDTCGTPTGTNRPLCMELCNQINCQTNAADTTLLPPAGTYDFTNPNNTGPSTSRVVFVVNLPSWNAMKSSTDEIGGVTVTTDLAIQPSQQGLFVTSFGISFSSPVTFGTASGNIMADGMLLLSGMGGVREITPTSDLAYAVNRLSVGADTFMIDNYAIVTSGQQLYRFSGTKMTRDASGGTLFINEAARTAVYSMSAAISEFIRNAAPTPAPSIPPLSYNLEVVGSNVMINFGDGSFRITGSMLAFDDSAGDFLFTGSTIGGPQLTTIPNINQLVVVQESTATTHAGRAVILATQYTDTFTNTATQQALSVNNPRVLSIIRTIMSFSGTVGQFTVTSTGVTFNGVSVMQLMRGSTQSFALAAGDQLSYTNGALTVTSGGNQVFSRSGVQRVTVQQGSGAAINDGSAAAISGPGTLFFEGNMAFFTNDASVVMMVGNQIVTATPATTPTTISPTTPAAPMVTVRTENGMVIVSIDGMDTVIADSSRRMQITTGQSIRYQNQNLVVFPSGGGNPVLTLMNIGQYVFYNTGDQTVTTFTGTMPGIMAMTGTLYYDGSRAFFTNRAEINDAIDSALNPTMPPTNETPMTTDTTQPSVTTPSSPPTTSFTGVPPTVTTEGPTASDGSRWVIGPWTMCSRTCGVGIQFRTVRCSGATFSVQCTRDPQLSVNIPTTYQFCNRLDCPGENRNMIPRPELGEVNLPMGGASYIYRINNVDTNTRSFAIRVMGFDRLSGSTSSTVGTQLGGIPHMRTTFMLSTSRMDPQTMLQVFDMTNIRVNVNGMEAYIIRLANGDMCRDVNGFMYTGMTITSGTRTYNGISNLVRLNTNTGVNTFEGMAPNGGNVQEPGLLCVSPSSNRAFFTTIDNVAMAIRNEIAAINVRPPTIVAASDPVTITDNGGSAPIGSSTVTANVGLDIILTCGLSDEGSPIPATRSWRRGSTMLMTGGRISVEPDRLVIRRVEQGDSGMYSCIASNMANLMNRANSTVNIVQPTQATTLPPTTQPPVSDDPEFVALQWSGCSRTCNGGVRVRIILCRTRVTNQPSDQCSDDSNLVVSEVCNTNNCPGDAFRDNIPEDQTSQLPIAIPDGDPQEDLGSVVFMSVITNSDVGTRSYTLTTTAQYPDRSTIVYTQTVVGDSSTQNSNTTLEDPVQVLISVQNVSNRIQIEVNGGHFFSVDVPRGNPCFNLSDADRFIYADQTLIIPTQSPSRFEGVQFVHTVNSEMPLTYETNALFKFQGPGVLCVSNRLNQPQAFFTQVPFPVMTILDLYEDIRNTFTAPVFNDVPSETVTLTVRRSGAAQVGQTIVLNQGNGVTLRTNFSTEGNPSPPDFEWFLNNRRITGNSYIGITPDGRMLFISRARLEDAGNYRVVARNAVGEDSDTSRVAVIPSAGIIAFRPMESTEPNIVNIGVGFEETVPTSTRGVNVFCNVTDAGSTTIMWTVNGVAPMPGSGIVIDNNILRHRFSSTLSPNPTVYNCTATQTINNMTRVFSRAARVTASDPTAPMNIMITGMTTVLAGGSTTLRCTATGVPEPLITWSIIAGSANRLPEFTVSGNNIELTNIPEDDDHTYRCNAQNTQGADKNTTTLNVGVVPVISPPENANPPVDEQADPVSGQAGQTLNVISGRNVSISCTAGQGTPAPMVTWFMGTTELPNGRFMVSGDNLVINSVMKSDEGMFRCEATNNFGTSLIMTTLNVVEPPMIMDPGTPAPPQPGMDRMVDIGTPNVSAGIGSTVCLRCAVTAGDPTPTIEFSNSRGSVNTLDSRLNMQGNDTLCVTVDRIIQGRYTCTARNTAGTDSESTEIVAVEAPRIREPGELPPPEGDCIDRSDQQSTTFDVGLDVCVGMETMITINCRTDRGDNVMFSWTRNGGALTANEVVQADGSLRVTNVQGGGSTMIMYECSASNAAGTSNMTSTITIRGEAPSIAGGTEPSLRPGVITYNVGTPQKTVLIGVSPDVQVLCMVSGTPTPTITWTVNGQPIPEDGALRVDPETGTLTIPQITSTMCATYNCSARNGFGTTSQSISICGEDFACTRVISDTIPPCSVTCGVGFRPLSFTCTRTFDGSTANVPFASVPFLKRPSQTTESCTQPRCPEEGFRFHTDEWTPCTATCRCGEQRRNVTCRRTNLDNNMPIQDPVDFAFCTELSLEVPDDRRLCNKFPCPEFVVGLFGPCSVPCGSGGVQTRAAMCIQPPISLIIPNVTEEREDMVVDIVTELEVVLERNETTMPEVRDDAECGGLEARPPLMRSCTGAMAVCPYVWSHTAWSGCSSTCRGGFRTRDVFCLNINSNEMIADSFCEGQGLTRPLDMHTCGTSDPDSCLAGVWIPTPFSACSATCGSGMRNRNVRCFSPDGARVIDARNCLAKSRPDETQVCRTGIQCPGEGECTAADEFIACQLVPLMNMCGAVGSSCCYSCPQAAPTMSPTTANPEG